MCDLRSSRIVRQLVVERLHSRITTNLHRRVSRSFGASTTAVNKAQHEQSYIELNFKQPPLVPVGWDQFNVTASQPVLFKAYQDPTISQPSRAVQLLSALTKGRDRIVEVEVGRYDDTRLDGFHQVSMRLGQYLDWLQSERTDGRVGGKQVYLAQWIGHGEIEAVRDIAFPPPVLSTLITRGRVDLYQSALFLGPTGAVTPLHYDPYINLFHLQASSASNDYAKHILLLPPSASELMRGSHAHSRHHNTSTLDFQLHTDGSHECPRFRVTASCGVSGTSKARDVIERDAVTCILRENETLLIPRGWWHRVENVALRDASCKHGGWTAGLSYWFLPRQQ
ncbi:hypothetical protein BDY19DRAFT_898144 [Irpex rosettiformis]|uniref:Uncharacterized protein n=1 Tax=Irpex rosettiformis TaxID=378272 RepID=A0ACB8TRF4_9APHY|nr:hypothetical protein BDY19DRAFT_898144 [Irpex rosettiformis]